MSNCRKCVIKQSLLFNVIDIVAYILCIQFQAQGQVTIQYIGKANMLRRQ